MSQLKNYEQEDKGGQEGSGVEGVKEQGLGGVGGIEQRGQNGGEEAGKKVLTRPNDGGEGGDGGDSGNQHE